MRLRYHNQHKQPGQPSVDDCRGCYRTWIKYEN
jgi:hypothetical protein